MTTQNNESRVSCYIKQVFTNNCVQYTFPTSIKVSTFIEESKKLFIDVMNVQPEKMEIVEAGQDIPNTAPECADQMEREDITMQDKYGENIKYKAFYVRYARTPTYI